MFFTVVDREIIFFAGNSHDLLTCRLSLLAALTFARPRKKERQWASSMQGRQHVAGFNVETADTICVAASSFGQLGCVFETKNFGREVIVTDLFAVAGPFQIGMEKFKDENGKVHVSFEAVNGQFVPSYASTDMVKNAMKRSWSNDGKVAITFCDDKRKEYVQNLK